MARVKPHILLPPSEGKAAGGDGPALDLASLSFPELSDRRSAVMGALERAMKHSLARRAKLLGVKGDALAHATAANRTLAASPTMRAIDRYTGVMFQAIDHRSLRAPIARRFASQVVLFSGLWGILGPTDAIPDYRIKMGASLPGRGRLALWWRDAISDALASHVGTGTVWDLLPGEHRNATHAALREGWIAVRFLDEVERRGAIELVTVSHWSKSLKGALVRFVLERQLDDPGGLVEFSHPEGYTYRTDLSTATEAVFVRPR